MGLRKREKGACAPLPDRHRPPRRAAGRTDQAACSSSLTSTNSSPDCTISWITSLYLAALDRIVAVVGTRPILLSEVIEEVNSLRAQGQPVPQDSAGQVSLMRRVVNELVDNEVVVVVVAVNTVGLQGQGYHDICIRKDRKSVV